MSEQFPAPNPEDLLIRGSVTEAGRHVYREDNGQFMSSDRVAEIGSTVETTNSQEAIKTWKQMTDEEQLAKAVADGYTNARQEGDTLVLGNKVVLNKKLNTTKVQKTESANELPSPNAEDLVISPYVNTEGKPLTSKLELSNEIHRLVKNGDSAGVEQASSALWSAARSEAIRLGDPAIMQDIKNFIDRSKLEIALQSNPTEAILSSPAIVAPDSINRAVGSEAITRNVTAEGQFSAPNAEGLVISSYVNAEGKPLTSNIELAVEMHRLVESGDTAGLEKAAMALWSAARSEAIRLGNPAIMQDIKNFIDRSRLEIVQNNRPTGTASVNTASNGVSNQIEAPIQGLDMWAAPSAEDSAQLDSNYFAAQIDQPTGRMSRVDRIRSMLFNVTPAVAISNFNARRQESGERPASGRVLMGIGAVAAGAAIAWRAGAFDHAWDSINNLWEGNKGEVTSKAVERGSRGSGNLENAVDMLSGNGGASSPDSSGNLENAVDMLSGDIPTPNGNTLANAPSTFNVIDAWETGDPTAWSWAESQGIPSGNVGNFLNEVMGSDWQQQARNMQIGDSLSATAEQIAKYKS